MRRVARTVVTLLVGSTAVLAACSTAPPPPVSTPAGSSAGVSSITWGFEQEFTSYNVGTVDGALTANQVVVNATLGGFWQFGPDGSVRPSTEFGTYEKISDRPLTVRYTIAEKARWSDGVPVGCDDLVLAWLARSGLTGPKGFAASGTAGYTDMAVPRCRAGERVVTVTYRRPFADWAAMFGPGDIMPAHVVRRAAGLRSTFVDLAARPTSPELVKAAAFWNTGWNLTPGRLPKALLPSSGPYTVESWTAGQSLTLAANPSWWGRPPRTPRIVIRYLAGTAQVQALRNGEIQVMDPQAQSDVITQLAQLGDRVAYRTADQFGYEHLDLNVAGLFRDRTVREAFARCVPRQRIVDDLVKPANPQAQVQQSRFVYPFQPGYAAIAAAGGGQRYDTVDIARAKALLAGRTPTVRIGWSKDPARLNKRRADTITLIAASCRSAGFRIVDAGTPTFFDRQWPAGTFDVALFATIGSPLVTSTDGYFTTRGPNNPYGYSNPVVDRLTAQLHATVDPARKLALQQQLDVQLWRDLATIPLFALPAVVAWTPDVHGIQYNPTSADLTWNIADWSRGAGAGNTGFSQP